MNRHHPNQLAAKIAAQNEANATANRLARELLPVLRPFVGRKIYNADGSRFHQFKKALPEFKEREPQIRIEERYGTLRACVKTCHTYPGRRADDSFATYAEASAPIGRTEGLSLESVIEHQAPYREDFSAEEIIAARKKVAEAKHALSLAQNTLYNFGEYDN